MTFPDIWRSLVRKDHRLENGSAIVEISSDNLQKLLRQVYDQGVQSVPKNGDLFDNLFGGLRR